MSIEYPISEIFESIQFEGENAGRFCLFVRFTGCNLNCLWCDTPQRNTEKMRLQPHELARRIAMTQAETCILTGGEPTIHNLSALIDALIVERVNKTIDIESNGTDLTQLCALVDRDDTPFCICPTISPKPPMPPPHEALWPGAILKLVYNLEPDMTWLRSWLEFGLSMFGTETYLQPQWTEDEDFRRIQSRKILELCQQYPSVRFSIQGHKFYGLE